MKTIMASSKIIDMLLLIIDINKGIEVQTAECLVLGELLGLKLIVVLNKCDMLGEKREEKIEKKQASIMKILGKTKFSKLQSHIKCIAFSAAEASKDREIAHNLINTIVDETEALDRAPGLRFIYLIDHCFSIKGKGTVVTGTVIQGKIQKGEMIEIPEIGFKTKIKSIQMFRKDINTAIKGDRVGMLLNGLNPDQIERSLGCEPGYITPCDYIIGTITKVSYWKKPISTEEKFHLSIGNRTVMASIVLFRVEGDAKQRVAELEFMNCNCQLEPHHYFLKSEYSLIDNLDDEPDSSNVCVALYLEKPVYIPMNSLFIGSKLELGDKTKTCRLSFSGRVLQMLRQEDLPDNALPKWYKMKERVGTVERWTDNRTAIVKDIVAKGSDITPFLGKTVRFGEGDNVINGVVQSAFGKSGKAKVDMLKNLDEETKQAFLTTVVHVEIKRIINLKL